ncbi:MAG: hypothetical protein HY318_03585 [Armatimonadetes bacterium]|nr:hypothetical protein [Armatimonadota bacterium]
MKIDGEFSYQCLTMVAWTSVAILGVSAYGNPMSGAPVSRPGNSQNRISPGHYGWLGDFHDSGGAYPSYYDRPYFRRHNINWFWLGNQWVVPFLLSDSNKVREAINEFKHSSRIWYEAFWWGDHSRWGEPGETQSFGLGSIPKPVLDKLKAKGLRPGGDNLAGKTWLDIAANPELMASVKKTIAWQLDTIFEHCGKDALYGVVLSEEEPEVCLAFGGQGAEAYEYFRANKSEVQMKMTRSFNELFDFVKDRYPWLKIAPGVYWQWVQPNLKRDAVVMDLYPSPGHEETAMNNWVEAWGSNTEHYILLWGYGDLDRKLECDRFDKVTGGLRKRGFKNLGYFHSKLALEDRIYRLFDTHGTGTYAPYNLAEHSENVRYLIAETEKIVSAMEPLIGVRMPARPKYSKSSAAYKSRKGLIGIADAWYGFRERLLDGAYDSVQKLKAYLHLSAIVNILQAEGVLPASHSPKTVLTPAAVVKLEKLSKEYPSLPEFYAELIPVEKGLCSEASDVAKGITFKGEEEFAPALRMKMAGYLGKIASDLRDADCLRAFENAQSLYRDLRTAGADRSWQLRVVFGNNYGYPLNMRVDVSVDYGDGKPVTIRSDTPFEGSSGVSEEWIMYLPKQPAAVCIDTVPWSGTLHVRTLEISQSKRTLTAKSYSDADHVNDIAEWISGKSPSFALSPWASRSGVRIAY